MSDEQRRAGLVNELRAALEDVAQVSERMSALLSKHVPDDGNLERLRSEMDIAKALASRLRAAIDTLDAAADPDGDSIALSRI